MFNECILNIHLKIHVKLILSETKFFLFKYNFIHVIKLIRFKNNFFRYKNNKIFRGEFFMCGSQLPLFLHPVSVNKEMCFTAFYFFINKINGFKCHLH